MIKLFFKFLYQSRYNILKLILFICIFISIFYLSNMSIRPVLYAAEMFAFFDIVLFFVKFYKYYKKHEYYDYLYNNIQYITDDEIPIPKNIEEEDYIRILNKLVEINKNLSNTYNRQHNESVDYYTLWVHQVKVPISVMNMILKLEDTDTNRELLAELFKIEQYVEMALSYFRLDEQSSDFVLKEYSLDNILKNCIKKFASQFIRKHIRMDYTPTDIKVLTDKKWLSFVIEQIISNAVKYTNSGTITIKEENNILRISDTGIGIASEDLPRIFERGYTGSNGRFEGKSTGLGLYLCNKAIKKMSHKIYAESEVGVGTSIFIDLNHDDFNNY